MRSKDSEGDEFSAQRQPAGRRLPTSHQRATWSHIARASARRVSSATSDAVCDDHHGRLGVDAVSDNESPLGTTTTNTKSLCTGRKCHRLVAVGHFPAEPVLRSAAASSAVAHDGSGLVRHARLPIICKCVRCYILTRTCPTYAKQQKRVMHATKATALTRTAGLSTTHARVAYRSSRIARTTSS